MKEGSVERRRKEERRRRKERRERKRGRKERKMGTGIQSEAPGAHAVTTPLLGFYRYLRNTTIS